MKKIILPIALACSILFTSCIGSFSLTNNVLGWNKEVTSDKLGNNLLFYGLVFFQVYTVTLIVDVFYLNVVENWDGKNPLSMEEGEMEQKLVKKNGKTYQITATKNNFEFLVVKGDNEGEKLNLNYQTQDKSWNAILPDGESIKISSWKDGFYYVHTPDQGNIKIDSRLNLSEGLAKLNSFKNENYCFN